MPFFIVTGAAVTSSVPGNSLPNNSTIGNVVGFTNGIDGNGWPNYFVLDSNGNLHIGGNTGNTSGAIIWDGGGSQLFESEAGGITLAPYNGQFIVAAQGGPAVLNVEGFICAGAVSVYGNVVAQSYAINGSNTFLASNGNGAGFAGGGAITTNPPSLIGGAGGSFANSGSGGDGGLGTTNGVGRGGGGGGRFCSW